MDDVEAQAPAAASPTSAEVTETEAPHPLPESEIPWHHDPEFETHGPLYDSWILKDTSHAERYGEWSNGAFIFVSCSFRAKARLGYTLGVVNALLTAFLIPAAPWAVVLLYVLKFPVMIGIRWWVYIKIGYQWFIADLCYFVGLAIMYFYFFMPSSPEFFMLLFSITHGPPLFAALVFRNQLVFHSLDKITSLLTHLTPPIVTHCIRWYSPWGTGLYTVPAWIPDHSPAVFGAERFIAEQGTLPWLFYGPVLAMLGHQVIYFLLVQALPNKKLKSDPTMLTSYRMMTRNHKSPVWKFINMCGRPGRVFNYFILNFLYSVITLALAPIWWNYYWADFGVVVLATVICTWNGAGYYINHFVHKSKLKQ